MIGLIGVNLGRRPGRTLLTAGGIAIGVATIVALLSLTAGLRKTAGGLVNLGKGNIALFQADVSDPTSSALPLGLTPRVARQPGVKAATPLLLVIDGVKRDPAAIVFGVEPDGFVGHRLVYVQGRPPVGNEAVIGDDLASTLHVRVGQPLTIKGKPFPVVGIYHAGVPFQDSGAVLPLRTAQALTDHPWATAIAVELEPTISASAAQKQLLKKFPGTLVITNPDEAARADANGVLVNKAVVVITVLALVFGGIAVTNTMIMSMIERQRELALLAAVGWSPRQIGAMIFGEGIGLSLIGAGIGLGLGILGGEVIVRALSASALVSPDITAWGLGRGLLVGIGIGVVGGLYPAWRVTRLAPASVLARA